MELSEIKVYKGRPADAEGRLAREQRVYDFLDGLGIEYERADHPHADTMEDCLAVDEALGTKLCKNLFLCNRQQTVFYLLLMPGDKPFKTKELSAQIQPSRLSFAGAEHMLEFLDIEPGAVSLLGLMNDRDKRVQLLVDEDLLRNETIGCHPCVNTSSLKLKTEDALGTYLQATEHEYKTVTLTGEA